MRGLAVLVHAVALVTFISTPLFAANNYPPAVEVPPLEVVGDVPFAPAPNTMEAAKNFHEGTHYWFDPAVFPGRVQIEGHPQGPGKARGLVIWTSRHSEKEGAELKVAPIMQVFAEQGWDVYNLMRHSILANSEGTNMRPWIAPRRDNKVVILILAIAERARAMGYRRVILAGDGRGGHESVRAGRFKASVEGILSLAPAIYDEDNSHFFWRRNHTSLFANWQYYTPNSYKIAMAFFEGDHLHELQWPNIRGPASRDALTERQLPHFVIDQPKHPSLHGHSAGLAWPFARRYGPCLVIFFETGVAPACDDRDPATAATFGIQLASIPVRQGDFAGLWQGTWGDGRFAVLAVNQAEGGMLNAIYLAGAGVDGDQPGAEQWRFILGGDPVMGAGGQRFVFRAGPDGTLLGEQSGGVRPAGQIILHRMP